MGIKMLTRPSSNPMEIYRFDMTIRRVSLYVTDLKIKYGSTLRTAVTKAIAPESYDFLLIFKKKTTN